MKKFSQLKKVFVSFFFGISSIAFAQYPTSNVDCDPGVTYYAHDFTGNSAGVWSTPNDSRNGHCCGVTGPDQCIALDILLDDDAAGIQIDMVGADPSGSLFYQINCTGNYPGGTIKCITGGGLQHITFCKPGSNANIYIVTSISKPLFPFDDTVRVGCTTQLSSLGVVDNQTNWTSIYPGAQGAYNSLLSCTNCASPIYTPLSSSPPYVEYQVCGFPQASECGFNVIVCDTVRIYNLPALSVSVSPLSPTFCDLGPGSGVLLTATGSGGLPPYTYIWRNSANVIVGTGSTYFATQAGNYTVEIKDALFNSASCPSFSKTIAVVKGSEPIVSAGADQKVCATSPTVSISGAVQNATGGVWSGGSGIFNPGNTFLNTNYTATSAEIVSGSVTLTLTSIGSGGSCVNKTDQVTIYFSDSIKVNLSAPPINCGGNGSTTLISSTITGGTAPLTYAWNTGANTTSITVGQGNYTLSITDSLGCRGTSTINIVSPPALTIGFTSIDVTLNGGNDGSATVIPGGGTPPYTYLWSTSETSATIDSLVYGAYTVTITDANGCIISGSIVISEPPCLGLNVTATSTNILCYGASNGMGVAIASGGTLPYTYIWNDPLSQANDTAFNLPPGAYTITVLDSVNCTQTANVSITQPENLINTMTQTDNTIVGANNGTATANPFGGTSPYSYLWSTGGTTQTITNLYAGGYSVTITDANGCSIVDSIYVNEPPCTDLTLNVMATNVACYGGNTGSATASVSNANPPFTILWSNGQTGFVATGLSAGNYSVTIIDAINCAQFKNFTITEAPLLSVSNSYNPVICNGAHNGTIDLVIAGGTFPYVFNWSNGATTEDLINLGPGTYSVTITDKNGCTATSSAQIVEPTSMSLTSIVTYPNCIYESNGAIDITVTGGTAPYFYAWSNSATTQDLNVIQAGGYSVIVTDANSCTLNNSPVFFSVDQPDSLELASYTVACPIPGAATTLVTVVPSGGNPGTYQVSFDNGSTFLPAGDYDTYLPNGATYYIVLKDNKACSSIVDDTIVVKPLVIISGVTFSKCFPVGTTTTLVTVNASGGDNGPYSVSYDNGTTWQTAGTMSFTLNVGTTYNIIIKDGRGCQSVVTTIVIPAVLNATLTSPTVAGGYNITCNGATNGSINLTVSGGTSSYTYAWTGPGGFTSTSQNPTGLSAGTYTVTITDANGCTITKVITLTQPAVLSATATSPTVAGGYNMTCSGTLDGSINLTVSGGTAPYSYAWTGPGTFYSISQNPANLGPGTYNVTVTDANGCTATTSITLTQPGGLGANALSPTVVGGYNITCNGAMNGAINLTITGGAAPYSYSWTGPSGYVSTSQNLTGLDAGTYNVIVTDANSCTATTGAALTQPIDLGAIAISPTVAGGYNITCNGTTNGSINLSVSGGTSAYTYAWTGPGGFTSTFQNLTALAAGTYNVIVTDANGCTATTSITLTQPSSLTSGASVSSNYNGQQISCFNANNGAATVAPLGGTPPYSYSWSTSPIQNTATANNLGASTYTVTVTDMNGCLTTATVTLTQPTQISASATVISNYNGQNISCNGANDGIANVIVSGGTAPFSYTWSTVPVQTNDTVFSLGASTYTVSVSDINNCASSATVSLSQPPVLTANAAATSMYGNYNISCNGLTDGLINLTINGGVGPYDYNWTNGATIEDLINIGAGTYSVVVTDQNGCTANATATLSQPDVLNTQVNSTSNYNGYGISCFGLSNGSIDIGISGGSPIYQYTWSNGANTQDLLNLSSGSYTLYVTDANNCKDTLLVGLTQPNQLTIIVDSTSNYNGYGVSCNQSTNGYINISPGGGVLPYYYLWNNGDITEDISNLGAGLYAITLVDANGCLLETDTLITEPEPLTSSYTHVNPGCNGASNGSIDLTVYGGVNPYSYDWNIGAVSEDIANLGVGGYQVIFTDLNGCIDSANILLTEPNILSSEITKEDVSCFGYNDGSIDLSISGGVKPYSFSWSNGASTQNVDSLSPGMYYVTITDIQGCSRIDTIEILEPDSLVVSLSPYVYDNGHNISTYLGSNGSIDLNISGGVAPYSCLWSCNSTDPNPKGLPAGEYTVLVTDSNKCPASGFVRLDQPLDLEMPTGYTPNADGNNDFFVVHGVEAYPDNEITIYNRWGNIVYQKKKYFNEWNGTNTNGDELPEGTYFVILEINDGKIVLKGYVEMKR
ncbi:MAG: hypothetical protein A3F72_05330 [Bacteroidetes bacterium RIFCSPLOWO2_12_FULL_35_15]|nr:MAG: hypothetical protein A3F72_05330 [Bacteroidetes bacterium RIFCSPLOWO2_12_FULL_35_15]